MTAPKTRTKCRDPSSVQKTPAPHPSPASGRGRTGGRQMPSRDGGLAASAPVLRAEEPRPRIADHVAPLVVERTARPIAARTPDRISPTVGRIGDVAGLDRIGGICRVRNRAADDRASSKAAENAEPNAAATAARLGVAWCGDRGKREHTCGGDSGHRCLHALTSFKGMIASRSFDFTQVFSNHVYPSTRRYGISRMPPSRRASLGYADSGTPTGI